jgi:hypothetical protein
VSELDGPVGIALLGGEVFVSDTGNHRIQVFDREGRFLRSFGTEGDGPGQLGRPMHIHGREGKLYVAEYLNDRIQIFSPEGESLGVIGRSGSGPGELDAPGGVGVDGRGRIYVADFYNQRVQILSAEGAFLRQMGVTGEKNIWAGRFNYPTDVALLPNGDVVVADAYNDRIQVFDSEGNFSRKWGGPFAINIPGGFRGWFRTATGVAVGPDENISLRQASSWLPSAGEEQRLVSSNGRPISLWMTRATCTWSISETIASRSSRPFADREYRSVGVEHVSKLERVLFLREAEGLVQGQDEMAWIVARPLRRCVRRAKEVHEVTETRDDVVTELHVLRLREGHHGIGGLDTSNALGRYDQADRLFRDRARRFHLSYLTEDLGKEQTVPRTPGI